MFPFFQQSVPRIAINDMATAKNQVNAAVKLDIMVIIATNPHVTRAVRMETAKDHGNVTASKENTRNNLIKSFDF